MKMVPLLIPVAVAGLGVAAYVHAKNSPHGKIMSALDAHMPAALRKLVAQSVTSTTADPKKLATLAAKLQTSYPVAAAVVATRVIQVVPPKPIPAKGLAIAPHYAMPPSTGVVDPFHLVSDGTADLSDVTNAMHQFDLRPDDERSGPTEY